MEVSSLQILYQNKSAKISHSRCADVPQICLQISNITQVAFLPRYLLGVHAPVVQKSIFPAENDLVPQNNLKIHSK